MHLHILGIGGTFMGGIAAIAKSAGHRVTGSDRNVYPPMSTQLTALGIELIEGYAPQQLDLGPDVVVVGNVLSRGMPVVEALLDRGLPYTSGPQWLAEQVLRGRHVIAVAGTHGKTTTTSMLAWILEHSGSNPGFLIGGVPGNFSVSARLGTGAEFVIEADEYDTAFFDKRAKFVHYRPRTAVLNNLEYDHADIYPNVEAIRWQFQQLLRMVPACGRLIVNAEEPELARAIAGGCWTPQQQFSLKNPAADWSAQISPGSACSRFEVLHRGRAVGVVAWDLFGEHNVMNALAAIAGANAAGVSPQRAAQALSQFQGVKRRMELRGIVNGIAVYDDFAHHPTAIDSTVRGLRARVGGERIVAVLEPRSNTMRLGVHREELAGALAQADVCWFYEAPDLGWDLRAAVAGLGSRARFSASVDELVAALAAELRPHDHALIMSNGAFGGLHTKLLAALGARA
jgi:UDP-N-acetylmuramate: L-alanyl-gamma-D-glutamyl-meso-diaminopimelate ligase